MKRTVFIISICFSIIVILSSCSPSIKIIGTLNMVSQRNIDSDFNYERLTTYSGGTKKEITTTTAKSLEEAVDQTVKKVEGGEFIMNARIYLVNGDRFAIEGDVWGKKDSEVAYKGFKVNDKVIWRKGGRYHTGHIESLQGDACLIKRDDGKIMEVPFTEIRLIQNED